jgi:branched-chain amino acid transport system substrate-binding protein
MPNTRRFLLAVLAATAAQFSFAQQAPIVIGASIPMTGGVSTFGQHSRWGSELAMDQANAAGGVLGRKIEID